MVAGKWEHYAWREKKQKGERKVKDRVFQTQEDEQARMTFNDVNDLLILDMVEVMFIYNAIEC